MELLKITWQGVHYWQKHNGRGRVYWHKCSNNKHIYIGKRLPDSVIVGACMRAGDLDSKLENLSNRIACYALDKKPIETLLVDAYNQVLAELAECKKILATENLQ